MTEIRLSPDIAPRLLAWYDEHARELPWRSDPSPYRVWVSEIMLQQTRVEAVRPYFERFMGVLPDVAALAGAEEDALMKLWEGLGYYSRARNLQKAARVVMQQHGGALPASYEALRALPGIGPYTAGAVASIAFGIPVPAVDGNVLRVVMRLAAREDDISRPDVRRAVQRAVTEILPEGRAGDFNQALMELGATVCVPGGPPRCEMCPAAELCRARAAGVQETLPVKTAKKPRSVEQKTVFVLVCDGKAAVRKRAARGLLAGLWELPNADGRLGQAQARALLDSWGVEAASLTALGEARHVFTHREWHMCGWCARVARLPDNPHLVWVTRAQLDAGYALPSAFRAYAEVLRKLLQ